MTLELVRASADSIGAAATTLGPFEVLAGISAFLGGIYLTILNVNKQPTSEATPVRRFR